MEDLRFDAIARFLDTIQTRRSTLISALGGVIGIVLLSDPASEAVSKRKRRRRRQRNKNRCQGGRTRCGGKCVDTKTDAKNCGRCLHDCDDEVLLRAGSNIFKNEAGNAGGIHNKGVLAMSQGSQIAGNPTTVGGGGGLLNDQGAVTIDARRILINKAVGTGSGILILGGAVSVANNTEIGGNEGTQGGGVFIGNPGEFEAADSAITNNGATLGGGNFNTGGGVVTLDNQSAVVVNNPNNCVGTNACGA